VRHPLFLAVLAGAIVACGTDPVSPDNPMRRPDLSYSGSLANLNTTWLTDFETDVGDWSTIGTPPGMTRVASGTGGITSAGGAYHATAAQGAFSRFGAYSGTWPGAYVAEIAVYLDPSWPVGKGFDYAVASSNSAGAHRRDFIFHVGVATDGRLLVTGDNNTDFTVNNFILTTSPNVQISSAGWYTLQHVFYEDAGVLAVDLNLLDSAGNLLWSRTRSDASDLIPSVVGGNRYGWFTVQNITGLAVDNHRLATVVQGPGSKDDCKNGGWQAFGFRNQGLCVASFNGNG
jgi:hypothetical protein